MSWIEDNLWTWFDPGEEDMESTTITADKVVHYTEKAILIEYEGEEMWIPRSQIEETYPDETLQAFKDSGLDISITISEWLAEQKGIL